MDEGVQRTKGQDDGQKGYAGREGKVCHLQSGENAPSELAECDRRMRQGRLIVQIAPIHRRELLSRLQSTNKQTYNVKAYFIVHIVAEMCSQCGGGGLC